MEIRDPVHGTIHLSDAETMVLDTPEYQRLRMIKQLGFSEFSFPGATHNRYLHSIGVSHIAGMAFDQIFKHYTFSSTKVRNNFREILKIAALLHDVGHGPLSHAIEEVMPSVDQLNIKIYKNRVRVADQHELLMDDGTPRATHEDYTIKFITDSNLSKTLETVFSNFTPAHVACLIDKSLLSPDDFFFDNGLDFRPILSQLVSSELDVDRMDYLERDSYFCGTNYGKFDLHWMLSNLTMYQVAGRIYLALNRRALYTFDDFLLSRHHMHLMVYFHHKSIIYEEMLIRYLNSPECTFFVPGDINEYIKYTDYRLFEHLASVENKWAQRITKRTPYKVLVELHTTEESPRPENIQNALEERGVGVIWASSKARLSKYHSGNPEDKAQPIYVVDQYDRWDKPAPVDQSTEIFHKYEGTRIIDRLYVAPEQFRDAERLLVEKRL